MKLLEKIELSDNEFKQFETDRIKEGRSRKRHAAHIIKIYLIALKK